MPNDTSSIQVTGHARARLDQRRISAAAIEAVLTYGRRVYVRGAQIRAIGRREVERFQAKGIDLRAFEGLQVLVDPSGEHLITAYRNHNFRGLKGAW